MAQLHFKKILLLLLLITMPAFAIDEDVIYLENDPLQNEEINEDTDKNLESKSNTNKIKGYIQESPYLLGDYKGVRSKLQEHGIDIQSSYIIDSFAMRNRQKRISKGTYQGLYNLSVDLDSEKLKLYKGGKLHILYQVGNKGLSSPDFLNTYSDINSYNPIKSINQISELYYEQSIDSTAPFFPKRNRFKTHSTIDVSNLEGETCKEPNVKTDLLNIKIGKQDANADFQALETGFEFLNLAFSYLDNTPMPLFPSQQMGVRARLKLTEKLYIQNGFYDGNLKIGAGPKSFFTGKNHYLNMTEIYKVTDFNGKEGKYLIGNWIKTGKYESFKNSTKHNNYSIYAGFEQKLVNRFEDNSGGLSIFGQFGYARNSINDVPYYGGGGLVFKGITKKRKDDSIGLAFGWHQFDSKLHKIENKTAEKVIELFYKIKLTEFLYIQPDIQYIIKPGGNQKSAFALGLRSCIVF